MSVHRLKCWPEFFAEVAAGRKRHELRRTDDRLFAVGDRLVLEEWVPDVGAYTGQSVEVEVTYITDAASVCAFSPDALGSNYAILSIALRSQRATP